MALAEEEALTVLYSPPTKSRFFSASQLELKDKSMPEAMQPEMGINPYSSMSSSNCMMLDEAPWATPSAPSFAPREFFAMQYDAPRSCAFEREAGEKAWPNTGRILS